NKAGNFNLGIVVLPDNLDPDEYVKKYGAEKYQNEVNGAKTPTEFFLERLAKKYNLNNDREKITYLDEAVKEIAQVRNPVERDMYIEQLARNAQVSSASLKANLARELRRNNRAKSHMRQQSNYSAPTPSTDEMQPSFESAETATIQQTAGQRHPRQVRLLYLFIHSQQAQKYLQEGNFHFPDKDFEELAQLWIKYKETHDNPQIDGFLDFIPEQLQGIIVDAEMANMPKDFTIQEINEYVQSLQKRNIYSRLNELNNQLQDAMRKQDRDECLRLTQKIIELKRVLG
ncbi:MAG: DNA primase, partial [Lactobacillus amylovorus]|nr:DNA primase [Lactobacillus amylovorus]